MSIRGLVIVLLLLAALGLGWRERAALQAWVASPRLLPAPSLNSGGASSAGALRKCVNGQQVTYTNVECPPGTKAQGVAAGAVTVVPGTPVPKPGEAASGPSALHKALDLTRDDALRNKVMERQMEGAR